MKAGFTHSTPVPLYWVSHGPQDAERLLILHGGPGAHHDYLLPQMLELARDNESVFYDQRGGGRSRHDDDGDSITWESQVRDCEAVVRELALEPLTLVGHSWGGLLALLYCVQAAHSLTPFRVTDRVQQSIWASLGDFDLTIALRDVHCPALVVHGWDDPIPLESS